MNILILGANGFIGFEVAHALLAAGHRVSGLGRNIAAARARLPQIRWIKADLVSLQLADQWAPLLDGIDAVVNCAGALQDGARDELAAIQDRAMRALYDAARPSDMLVVQISANTAGAGADLPFMATKRAADEALSAAGLRHVILRPALVIARNAHGSTALVRALSALPGAIPVFAPDTPIQTVAIGDIAKAVLMAVDGRIAPGADLDVAHPQRHSLASLIDANRAWLGLRPARQIPVPAWLARMVSFGADMAGWLGWRSPLRSTALAVLQDGILQRDTSRQSGPAPFEPVALKTFFDANPAGAQDLWFARLYLLKPVLIIVLAAFWILTGVVALADIGAAADYLRAAGLSHGAASTLTVLTAGIDIVIGLAVLVHRLARRALIAMAAVALIYLVAGSVLAPALWADPLGPFLKILPALLLSLTTLAVLEER